MILHTLQGKIVYSDHRHMREYNFYVYIVRCADGSYYTGITNSVVRRVAEHNEGLNPKSYVFRRRPVTLVYSAHFDYVWDAIAFEKQLKGWSRAKKEALIQDNEETLHELARCLNTTRHAHFKFLKKRRKNIHMSIHRLLLSSSSSLGMTTEGSH